MNARILWLENDTAQTQPYLTILDSADYLVDLVSTITEAEEHLNHNVYNLFILDVMIPTTNEEEEKKFPPDETDYGLKLGFCFYDFVKEELKQKKTKVLVLTQNLDFEIRNEFINAGLPPEQFCTKFALRDVRVFLKKVRSLLEN